MIEDQPPPVTNNRASIQSLVRADLEEREAIGCQRYGTPLQAFNGRDALVDAYQEALDLACYLRQAIEERGSSVPHSIDLEEVEREWLSVCGACDAGIGDCSHPARDYRPTMLSLVREIERLTR